MGLGSEIMYGNVNIFLSSLRSKGFHRVFRRFEAFWPCENWGKHKKPTLTLAMQANFCLKWVNTIESVLDQPFL